jgi:hypothetical protein
MTIVLDDDLLAAFEARLRHVGAAVVEHLAPGLDDERIDELLEPVAIDLPAEARTWWRWHNGTLRSAPPTATEIIPYRDLVSLQGAIGTFTALAEAQVEVFGMPELAKHLQLVSEQPTIYVDCNTRAEAPAPIYSQNDHTDPPRVALPSMGELITIWMQLIDDGIFATTPDGQWQPVDPDRVGPDLWERGII